MQHLRRAHVRDIGPVSQRHLKRSVAAKRLAHSAVIARLRYGLAAPRTCIKVDGVDDLHVARAAAQVHVDGFRDLVPTWRGVLIDERLGAERKARNAETTLEACSGGETVTDELTLGRVEPLEGQDIGTLCFGSRLSTGDLGFAIHDGEAAATLALRLASIFGREDVTPFT